MKIFFLFIITLFQALKAEVTDISPAQAKKLLSGKTPPLVIDLRTKEEYKQGHIANSVNIDMLSANFVKSLDKLDKDKTYIFHCKSGGRSTRAIPTFTKLKFKKLLHLKAGYDGWQNN